MGNAGDYHTSNMNLTINLCFILKALILAVIFIWTLSAFIFIGNAC